MDVASWIRHAAVDPAFGIAITLGGFQAGVWIQRRCGGAAALHPVLIAVVLIVLLLTVAGVPYQDYMRGAGFVGLLLGPATVALALPLYDNLRSIARNARVIVPAVAVGSLVSSGAAVAIARVMGASKPVAVSLASHSATTPVAMGIAEKLGGVPSLAAVFTLLTGVAGVTCFPLVFHLVGVKDWRARGLGVGTAAHGLGTARMLQLDETAGAYGGIGIGLGALITALAAPFLAAWLAG